MGVAVARHEHGVALKVRAAESEATSVLWGVTAEECAEMTPGVQRERGVSGQSGGRDEACPVSTGHGREGAWTSTRD